MTEVKLPMTCGDVTLHALGKLDPNAPGSHDDEYVYPIGFRTSRKHASATNPGSKCLYHSEIVAGPNGQPQFKVTCQDMSENPYEDSTPNGAWSLVMEAISACTRRSSRGAGPQVSERKGCDMFGLNSEKIKRLLMDMDGADKCTKLRFNKEKAAREVKERRRQEEEEEREAREQEDRERDKKKFKEKEKASKGKKKSSGKCTGAMTFENLCIKDYQQPPKLEELRPGEWRLMEEDMEVIPGGSEDQVAVGEDLPEGEQRQREQLHSIWQVIHLRLMMPAGERKRAPEMAEGDGWLDMLRDRLREQRQVVDEAQDRLLLDPNWTKFLDKDPMPDSIHQYFELSLRQRALILWWLCESLLEGEEEERLINVGSMDWDANAESLRVDPNAMDKDGNAYWYLEGSSGVLYKEGPAKGGRKAKQPRWEPISRGHEDLADVGSKLEQEAKKRKLPQLQKFAAWIVEHEAPKLLSKEQAKERAKSKAALLEMLPRKRSSRVATKEERDKEEEQKKQQREAELAAKKADEEKRRKDRERQQLEKLKQAELAKQAKEEDRQRAFKEAERERRLRKRRRLLAKQAQQAAAAQAAEEGGEREDEDKASEGDWWEIGNHVEVFSEDDWWQAVILKTRNGTRSGVHDIYVAYIGGSEDDNEWLSTTSVRVRPPTDSFWDNDGDGEDLDCGINSFSQTSFQPAQSASSSERKGSGGQSNGVAREQAGVEGPGGAASNGAPSHAARDDRFGMVVDGAMQLQVPAPSQHSSYRDMGVSSVMQGSMSGAGSFMVQAGMHMRAGVAANGPVQPYHVPPSSRPSPGELSTLLNSESTAVQPAGEGAGVSTTEEGYGVANQLKNVANGSVNALLH